MQKLPIVSLPGADAAPPAPDASSIAGERRELGEDDLQQLLEAFYAAVEDEPLLAPYFTPIDMRAHMPRIVDFWSTILFHTGRYSGNAFRPHLSMPGLTSEHFVRWVATLERTVDADFAGPQADRMKEYAHRIAYSMQLRLGLTPTAKYRTGGRDD